MKDYSSMTDLEINKAVAALNPSIYISEDGEPVYLEPSPAPAYTGSDYDEVVFDPCNNPADAWPIIKSSLICLTPYGSDGSWWEAEDRYGTGKSDCDNNPLRAAMVVYLMMKELCCHCGGEGYVEIKHTEFEIEQHLCHRCNKKES